MPPVESEISSLADFMRFVESAQAEIRESNSDDLLLFRGQPVDEPLLPKMARLHAIHRKYDISQRHDLLDSEARMLSDFKRRSRPLIQQRLKASGNGLHLLSITAWKRDFWIGPQMRLWGSISPWRMTDTMRNASSGSYAQQLGTLLRRLPSSIHSDSRQRNSIGPALCPRGS